MAKPMYVWNGSAWEAVAPTVPESPITYQASAPASPSTGDIWVDSDGDVDTFDRQLVRYRFVASGGETSLSGIDANGFTLAYVPGAEQVYLNGVLLVRTSDYTATDGTSITALSPALAANDVVEVFAYNSFNIANTYTIDQIDDGFATKAENGLVHINTTSVSGVASQSFNNVFSSTYDNYRLLINAYMGGNEVINLRFRAAGTDDSGTNYRYVEYVMSGTSITVVTSNTTSVLVGVFRATNKASYAIEISSPFLAEKTNTNSLGTRPHDAVQNYGIAGNHQLTNSYDGFTLIAGSGTFTGDISLYGYRKS